MEKTAAAQRSASKARTASCFWQGAHDGVPIALGYLAVSFSLGISAAGARLDPLQSLVASFLCNASAGEYAAYSSIAQGAAVPELVAVTLIANARHILMGAALAQRFDAKTPLWQRMLIAYDNTDELFALTIARPCKGALLGIVLPARILSALSVALFGMFLALIIPAAHQEKANCAVVAASFAASMLCDAAPIISELSSGTRTIILTFAIAGAAAWLFPVHDGVPTFRYATQERQSWTTQEALS